MHRYVTKSLVTLAIFFTAAFISSTALAASPNEALLARLRAEIDGNSAASPALKNFAKSVLVPLCSNSVFVTETAAQNAKATPLSEIQSIDEQWQAAEEELPIFAEKLGNACAEEIRKVVAANPAIIEAFVMDNQGAVVGENLMTSDYWQGDEPKWQNSYKDGQGGIDVGEESFDRSANEVIQQISLPIIDSAGNVIGAVTYGIATGKL